MEAKNIPAGTSHFDVKAYFAKFGKVRYVDFKNDQSAIVRFYDPEPAKIAVLEIAEKKSEIRGNVIEGRLLEGEEEKKYWDEEILPHMQRESSKRGRGGGRGQRGRGGGRGQRGRGGGRPAKRRKFNPKDEQ